MTAEIRVKGFDGVFVADRCEVDGGWVRAGGRWRWKTGPDYRRLRYSGPRAFTWPRSRIEWIRWTAEELAA